MAQTIREITKEADVIYVPSPGNWGDALINEGTVQFLDHYSIRHSTMKRQDIELLIGESSCKGGPLWSKVVIVGGGGGWCVNYPTTKEFTRKLSSHARHVIVMPTTFELDGLEGPVENVTYFTRDRNVSPSKLVESKFCHDMAFFLDIEGLAEEPQAWRVYLFRTDKERAESSGAPAKSVDISMLGNSYHTVLPFFQILSRFESIYTDRLHVAIAGSLLGKKVDLFSGNYFKSVEVWESSIKGNYPETAFRKWDSWDFTAAT